MFSRHFWSGNKRLKIFCEYHNNIVVKIKNINENILPKSITIFYIKFGKELVFKFHYIKI